MIRSTMRRARWPLLSPRPRFRNFSTLRHVTSRGGLSPRRVFTAAVWLLCARDARLFAVAARRYPLPPLTPEALPPGNIRRRP